MNKILHSLLAGHLRDVSMAEVREEGERPGVGKLVSAECIRGEEMCPPAFVAYLLSEPQRDLPFIPSHPPAQEDPLQ